jgi:hypothetical protein
MLIEYDLSVYKIKLWTVNLDTVSYMLIGVFKM